MQEINTDEVEPVPQVQAQQEEQPQAEVEESQEQREVILQPTKEEINWTEARKVLQAQKQEIEQLKHHLDEVKRSTAKPEVDEFANLAPDDVITYEQATRLASRKAEEAAKKVVEEYGRNVTYSSQEQETRTKFQDYDYVVEHFAVPMIQSNPALAAAIKASPNPFLTAYKLAKTSDDYEAQMSKQQTSPKAEKILKNAQRPLTANSVSPTLKGQADKFANMSKQDIWKMSQEYARKA